MRLRAAKQQRKMAQTAAKIDPLLPMTCAIFLKRGGRAIKKISRSSADREAGVVFRWQTQGKPPRLHRLWLLRDIFLMMQTPLLAVMQGGEWPA